MLCVLCCIHTTVSAILVFRIHSNLLKWIFLAFNRAQPKRKDKNWHCFHIVVMSCTMNREGERWLLWLSKYHCKWIILCFMYYKILCISQDTTKLWTLQHAFFHYGEAQKQSRWKTWRQCLVRFSCLWSHILMWNLKYFWKYLPTFLLWSLCFVRKVFSLEISLPVLASVRAKVV